MFERVCLLRMHVLSPRARCFHRRYTLPRAIEHHSSKQTYTRLSHIQLLLYSDALSGPVFNRLSVASKHASRTKNQNEMCKIFFFFFFKSYFFFLLRVLLPGYTMSMDDHNVTRNNRTATTTPKKTATARIKPM